MNRPVDEPHEATHPTTVLDRVRPTVVRRRVYEPGPQNALAPKITHVSGFTSPDDDESGPPSSVNVARALASLRADELHRLEEILSDDEEERAAESAAARTAAVAAAVPAVPTVKVGPTIAVAELARRMSIPVQDVVTSLVTRGFFSVTVKTSLPRDTARAAATLYGFQIEETDEAEAAPEKTRAAGPRGRAAAPAAKAKAKIGSASKTKAHAKPVKKKTGTRAR